MLAIYGQLLMPGRQVEYLIPYSTVLELYDMRESPEPVMPDPEEDAFVKEKIGELIAFVEEPLNRKKIEKTIISPWKKSAPILVNAETTLTIVYAIDNAQYGELFDPVETELLLTAMREQAPVLTDQLEFIDKLIEQEVPVHAFDIEDFEFAVEEDIPVQASE